jgi:hypothetical protein
LKRTPSHGDVRFGSQADILRRGAMSALAPKADICSALAHVRFGPKADIASLVDHPIGAAEQRRGDGKAEHTGGLHVDDQLELV